MKHKCNQEYARLFIVPEKPTAKYYYEWGSEPAGYVSTGTYVNDVWTSTGLMTKQAAKNARLKFHSPYN